MPTYPIATANLEVRQVGDETIVHDYATDRIHVLNCTAGWVLNACDGSHTAQEIVHELATVTGTAETRVNEDVVQLLTQFADLGLVAIGA